MMGSNKSDAFVIDKKTESLTDQPRVGMAAQGVFDRLARYPKAVSIRVEPEKLIVSGPVADSEIESILANLRLISEGKQVINRLEPLPIGSVFKSDFQSGVNQFDYESNFINGNWSHAVRVSAFLGSIGLFTLGLKKQRCFAFSTHQRSDVDRDASY